MTILLAYAVLAYNYSQQLFHKPKLLTTEYETFSQIKLLTTEYETFSQNKIVDNRILTLESKELTPANSNGILRKYGSLMLFSINSWQIMFLNSYL